MPRRMTVYVPITVTIDPDAWIAEYGVEPDEVRADVKLYVQSLIRDQLADLGLTAQQ